MRKRKANKRARELAAEHEALAGLGREIRPAPSAAAPAAKVQTSSVYGVFVGIETVVTLIVLPPNILLQAQCHGCDRNFAVATIPILEYVPEGLRAGAALGMRYLPQESLRKIPGHYYCESCAQNVET